MSNPTSPKDDLLSSPLSPTSSGSLRNIRGSIDSERSVRSPNGINGHASRASEDSTHDPSDIIARLKHELEQITEEKAALQVQHNNVLSKVHTMRTTLGNKLKQDAEELDRQEQLVQQLTAQNEDLTATVETLKEELIASHADAERAASDMRTRALHENVQENLARERELRETQAELERCKLERDEWERSAMQEKVAADEARLSLEELRRDLEVEREARLRGMSELEAEQEKASNLQSVLEDFQAAKDHELQQAIKEHESQLVQITQSLAEFKHRAHTAEAQLDELQTNSSRTEQLEKEIKEKNLLIGKLRHETVIINEHLTEALRRLRKSSSETNVDRRLVTNVLLSFVTTPRADPKRFEMLQLLASILSWTDIEREKAGLQQAHSYLGTQQQQSSGFWSRGSPSKAPAELEKADETESFSRLWVEFLLSEAASGTGGPVSPSRSNPSLPSSPSPQSSFSGRRLASFSGVPATSSSPSLTLSPPPVGNKGKEREPRGSLS